MGGKIPQMKAIELVKVLSKLGYVVHHQKGSHAFKHPDGRRTTIPIHPSQTIPRGTLRGIINDLRLNVEEFVKLL